MELKDNEGKSKPEQTYKRVKMYKNGERIPSDATYLKSESDYQTVTVNGRREEAYVYYHFYEVHGTNDDNERYRFEDL